MLDVITARAALVPVKSVLKYAPGLFQSAYVLPVRMLVAPGDPVPSEYVFHGENHQFASVTALVTVAAEPTVKEPKTPKAGSNIL